MKRNYNREKNDLPEKKYAYSFDFDIMHGYMMRSFEPFFMDGSLLELGSYKGDFTMRFMDVFRDITCVEASEEAIIEARIKTGNKVKFVNATFEKAVLPVKYDNIVITHVLEHLNEPVKLLAKIRNKWMSDSGRLFIVCPNANGVSRQIAVKMGLVSNNSAVTKEEYKHGHRITYSFDTLERDARAAGLKVVHRSGIFFKCLASFQWDMLLKTDIVTKEYIEGCYQLGLIYPDLSASVFLLF
jgi:2-polyprenyl-3-methyl-5-hydroxy-6-metoxy-1,4-benzoquinol methylase